jgi:hypothetical protein
MNVLYLCQALLSYPAVMEACYPKCSLKILLLPYPTVHSVQSLNFLTFKEPRKRFQEIDSASLCSLLSQYDNSIPRFLALLDCSNIPA